MYGFLCPGGRAVVDIVINVLVVSIDVIESIVLRLRDMKCSSKF